MKILEIIPLTASAVGINGKEIYLLRLTTPVGFPAWYEWHEMGFVVVIDEEANKLEDLFRAQNKIGSES